MTLLVAIVCLFLSFIDKQKSHATKLFSIMLVAALSLFSTHWATYFAAIFIVATAVTELEFLQNLAAILRKDENYFNYKKEALTKTENIRRKVEESIEDELVSEVESHSYEDQLDKIDLSELQELSQASRMKLAFAVEDKALNYLEKEFGKIERNVRLRKENNTVEFDGVTSNSSGKINTVFEVKWARNPEHTFMVIRHSLRQIQERIAMHELITGIKPNFYLIVISNTKTSLSIDKQEKIDELVKESGIKMKLLSLSEIGFNVIHNIA